MEEEKKRRIRFLVWQHSVCMVLWISWDMAISLAAYFLGMPYSQEALLYSRGFFRFLVFQISLAMLLVAHSHPHFT